MLDRFGAGRPAGFVGSGNTLIFSVCGNDCGIDCYDQTLTLIGATASGSVGQNSLNYALRQVTGSGTALTFSVCGDDRGLDCSQAALALACE